MFPFVTDFAESLAWAEEDEADRKVAASTTAASSAAARGEIAKIGIVGMGSMGHGIAQLSAGAGYEVVAVERADQAPPGESPPLKCASEASMVTFQTCPVPTPGAAVQRTSVLPPGCTAQLVAA